MKYLQFIITFIVFLSVRCKCQRKNSKCFSHVQQYKTLYNYYDHKRKVSDSDDCCFSVDQCCTYTSNSRKIAKIKESTGNLLEKVNSQNPIERNTIMTSNEHFRSSKNFMSSQQTDQQESSLTGHALVLYDESKILPHHKAVRSFDIAGNEFVIHQDWTGQGVAAVVWDSAVVLGTYMDSNQHLIQGKKVLELGAGTGLAGLVAASLGADVTVTERKEAMHHLKSTVENNTVRKSWSITSLVLDWTDDHNTDTLPEYDVIIGADIIYIVETFQDLLKTLKTFAKSSKTLVLISCKIRYERDETFLNMLREYFDVTKVFFDNEKKINIFSARRKE